MTSFQNTDDIAIVGMSCRVAGANSPSELWELLETSRDVQKEIVRFNSEGYYKPTGGKRKGLTNVRHAYFLDGDIDRFDNGFFAIPATEALAMDPQQRLLLEIAYEAIESAGMPLDDFQGSDTAVYTGLFTSDYGTSLLRDIDSTPKYHSTGTSNSIAANRLSYFFDLHGPSMVIDTACSSTIVALHQAVLSLKNKEASMALVCGANLIINPDMFVHMSELGFLSPEGRCKSFDAFGNGYARGEGVLALLLKPLGQALQDGDPIRSVIRGTRINQDGRTNGITLPSPEAQKSNMMALYRDLDISPADVQYLEAHGTGTAVGDPLEMSAVNSVFSHNHKASKLVVGSVKSNVGHLEACAALVGIIKVVECLERGLIPPQMHFLNPNPKIDFQSTTVPTALMQWPKSADGGRRAAVNSFGFGGTNGHAVLDYYPVEKETSVSTNRPWLFKFSAANEYSLGALATLHAKYVETQDPSLERLAYTLLARRSTLKKSFFLTASSNVELVQKLRNWEDGSAEPLSLRSVQSCTIGFVFTGQGAQWAEMSKQLIETSVLYATVIDQCDEHLAALKDGPDWKIRDELCKTPKASRINESSFSQPLCTALQLGLVQLWREWGITPRAVFGHSSGEIAAAFCAGILSLRDAIVIAFYRGLYMGNKSNNASLGRRGAMCAVGMGETECNRLLEAFLGRVVVAAINSPSSCTLSGDEDAILEIQNICKERGTFCRALRVDMAYHSHHMQPLAPLYEQSLRDAGVKPCASSAESECEMFSSVTQQKLSPSECTPDYWAKNMVSPVQFTAALTEAMRCHDLNTLIEIGPHPALKGPSMDTLSSLGKVEINYFGSCYRNQPTLEKLLSTVGEMIVSGLPVLTHSINRSNKSDKSPQVLTDLPTYPWDHAVSHWAETRVSKNQRFRAYPRHEVLGARINSDTPLHPVWKNMLRLKEVEWLEDMMASGVTELPESAFIIMALEAAQQIRGIDRGACDAILLSNIQFLERLPLSTLSNEDGIIETYFSLRAITNSQKYVFTISAAAPQDDNSWKEYCTGTLSFGASASATPSLRRSISHDPNLLEHVLSILSISKHSFHALCFEKGRASGELSNSCEGDDNYHIQPWDLFSLMQLPALFMIGSGVPSEHRLEFIEALEVSGDSWSFSNADFDACQRHVDPIRGITDIQVYDTQNHLLSFRGIRTRLDRCISQKVPLRSLFFKPEVLPDITFLKKSTALQLARLIQLITHKWPMSDFGSAGLSADAITIVRSHLKGFHDHERPRFRSLTILSEEPSIVVGRTRITKNLTGDARFHIMFSNAQSLDTLKSHIRHNGFICAKIETEDDRKLFSDYCDLVCKVDGFGVEEWLLGRPQMPSNGVLPSRKLKKIIFTGCDAVLFRDEEDVDLIPLRKEGLDTFYNELARPSEPYDLIFMDCGRKSVLVDWTGCDLLPWIQSLLDNVAHLLWVTTQTDMTPFSNVASSFLRTLLSEHPSLKAANLVFRGNHDPLDMKLKVFEVMDRLIHGSNELELIVQNQQVCALRYLPDDELSASVGVTSHYASEGKIGNNNYEVSLAEIGKTILVSNRGHECAAAVDGTLEIAVQASVVDFEDITLFSGASRSTDPWSGLGQFFAGTTCSGANADFPPGELVVGWHLGAHKSRIQAPSMQLVRVPQEFGVAEAVAHYAAYSVAITIVCDIARARKSERVRVQVPGLLAEALSNLCRQLQIFVDTDTATDADFTVEFDRLNGLVLNGKKISVKNYMSSGSSRPSLSSIMSNHARLRGSITKFELGEMQMAFDHAHHGPLATVLIHTGSEMISGHRLTHKPPKSLFNADAAYVIVGGLGGLGRYLMTWMINRGAKHLVTISRSGLDSEDAKLTVKAIERLGAEVQVFKADACDPQAVDRVMRTTRAQRPIRGCLNMILVLDNSPFMTMTGTQWDRALRSKVDSTWNLHQTTLADELDLFIMFSSISSICGNRTQANYATGNSFQNAMAEYRRSIGLTAISIALGVMSGIGVLADDHDLRRTLSQSGLQALDPYQLTKVTEAAILESRYSDRYLISVGFDMFEAVDDAVQAAPEQNQLFWTEFPEFSFLLDHKSSASGTLKAESLLEQLQQQTGQQAYQTLLQAFLGCLSNILGYDIGSFDSSSSLASYGVDSLNAVSCRYWFFKELQIDVPVFDVLGCRSINELISRVLQRMEDLSAAADATAVPQPIKHDSASLTVRPISHSQSRLWFLQKLLPDKTVYNLLLACHIIGTLDVKLFIDSWSLFMRRHEVLHSKIIDTVDGLQQVPTADVTFTLIEVETTDANFENEVVRITETARSHIFDLESGHLIRGWLIKAPKTWRFFLASHHLAWDRTSVPTIFDETSSIYRSLLKNNPGDSALAPVPYQFIDYTLWQEKWMGMQGLVEPHVEYWRSQLNGIPESVSLLPMALISQRPKTKQYDVQTVPLHIGSSLATLLKAFCKSNAVTPFMFMASAVSGLVHRFTGDNDIVIGIADGDRGHTEFDSLVGFTVNMLAIRSKMVKDMRYLDLLENYRTACLEAYEHRAIPFDYLLQRLEIPRRTSHSPVFQITVNYQMQGSFPECDYGDFKFTKYDHYNARSQSDFMLDIEETPSGALDCTFSFDTSLYDQAAVTNLANTFSVFIENIIATKGLANLDSINVVPPEDHQLMTSVLQPRFESWPSLKELDRNLFPDLFTTAVNTFPTKPAIIDDARTLTYAELGIATNRVATFLIGSGARNGDSIGICCEQGVDMVVAMYGVVRAGCAYVPIDPDFPEERISSMIEDVEVEHILVDRIGGTAYQKLLTAGVSSAKVHLIGELAAKAEDASPPLLRRRIAKPDSFCCIFTSGSTGRPKGVRLGHTQLRYQMEGYHSCIQTTSEDRNLLSSAMVFDMSLPSIYGTIMYGATMVIASRDARYSPTKMVEQLIDKRISSCTFTTTQLKMLLTAPNKARLKEWTTLRSIVIGGEQIPPWVVREFYELGLPHASIFNGYAPSETTVCNSLRTLLPDDAKRSEIPLEKPLFPSRFHILDDNMNPVPLGNGGELYIGGPTVNEGYVKRDEITATTFLRDPFASVAEIEEGNGKLYRTGDTFRLLRNGTIQALGRIGGERQVKIRGMRTELDEIENVIHDACQVIADSGSLLISLVAVVYHKGDGLEGVLAAYLAAREDSLGDDMQRQSMKAFIRLRMKAALPTHMIPSTIVFLPDLPRMVSGKIDYKTILTWDPPAPETNTLNRVASNGTPLTRIQSAIASVWKEILHFDGELSSNDEFFALGGHSLILLHVQSGIRKFCNADIALGDMFAHPTIEGMEQLVLANLGQGKQDGDVNLINGATDSEYIDWDYETSLSRILDSYAEPISTRAVSVVAITGACTMAGAHFIHHVLLTTNLKIVCIGTDAENDEEARRLVFEGLKHWCLFLDIPHQSLDRLLVYHGSLAHPSLGLTDEQVSRLDREVHAIYQLDSDVSLLKRYDNLRSSNVGSLQFLISLACGKVGNTKAIHYLSTWGVPHLQAWNETELKSDGWLKGEVEMTNMKPGANGSLGYLKARWACEAMLYQAAQRGIPVTIFRSCMCGGSPGSGVALARTDINRRILEGSLQVGMVPDFSSSRGGGMSWITADFLIQSILHLSQRRGGPVGAARIHHIVSDNHVPYTELADLLDVSYNQTKMVSVEPEIWFEALRANGNPEMTMQAEVLEKWCTAGWVPFGLEAKETLALLKKEKDLVPPQMSRDLLMKLVVGEQGF